MPEGLDSISPITTFPVEREPTPRKKVLIFGQGPVIDAETRLKAQEAHEVFKEANVEGSNIRAGINFWSEDISLAAVELYKLNPHQEFIVMGGQTGGKVYASEAALIKASMVEKGIPPELISTEEDSTDTIENLVNMLNMGTVDYGKTFDVICAPYHSMRLKFLMKLYDIPFDQVFRSDAVIKYTKRREIERSESGEVRPLQELLDQLELRLDLNNSDYYQTQKGTENRPYVDRLITDDVLIRELIEYPEKWLSYVPKINDEEKVQRILRNAKKWYTFVDDEGIIHDRLMERFGIDITGNLAEVKKQLARLTHHGVEAKVWDNMKKENPLKGWDKESEYRLHIILGMQGFDENPEINTQG